MKTIALLFLVSLGISMCDAASAYTNRHVLPLLLKREENCDISCSGENANCEERCKRSHIASIVGELRYVCQEGVCYCGFEKKDDHC